MQIFRKKIFTPYGALQIGTTEKSVVEVSFCTENTVLSARESSISATSSPPLLHQLQKELCEYFSGTRHSFDLPLQLAGTAFQQKVFQEMLKIPYGETRSYGELAYCIGLPDAARAVGGACHRNPVAILIPCHRVVGAHGALGGFGGGLSWKKALLALEGSR